MSTAAAGLAILQNGGGVAIKRFAVSMLAAALLLCSLPVLADAPVGFGYINTDRTNIRKGMGEDILLRLDAGDSVFVTEARQDGGGARWYRINTEQEHDKGVSGWVQAQYVTAGDALFSDVVQVATGDMGMLALRADGSVVGVANENWNTRVFQDTVAKWRGVRQVACGYMSYFALLEDGSLRGFGNMAFEDWNRVTGVRLLSAYDSTIAYLTETGTVSTLRDNDYHLYGAPLDALRADALFATRNGLFLRYADGSVTCAMLQPLADEYLPMAAWQDVRSVACGAMSEVRPGTGQTIQRPLYVALTGAGGVLVAPEAQMPETRTWTGLVDVKAGWDFVLGLRADGTAIATGQDAELTRQVAAWRGITAIAASNRYCVGIRQDGTLVFAGTYQY